MKKQITILSIISLIFIQVNVKGQTANSVLDSLKSINFNNYVNHSVDSFLNAIPSSYIQLKLYPRSVRSGYKNPFLSICYPSNIQVVVKVKKYQYMNPVDTNMVWDINLFRKEKIYVIEMYDKGLGLPEKDAIGN